MQENEKKNKEEDEPKLHDIKPVKDPEGGGGGGIHGTGGGGIHGPGGQQPTGPSVTDEV